MAGKISAPELSLARRMLPFLERKAEEFTEHGGVAMICDDMKPETIFTFDRISRKSTKHTHVTEYSAMMDGRKMFRVFKACLEWSILAQNIKVTDSAEHGLQCASIYGSVQSQNAINTMAGEETKLDIITAKAQKQMIQCIDDLALSDTVPIVVMEASGKVENLKKAAETYSNNVAKAVEFIENNIRWQNGEADCSLFESKVALALLIHFDTLCEKESQGEDMKQVVKDVCFWKFHSAKATPLPSFSMLKTKLMDWFPDWQTESPFPVNQQLHQAMQEAFKKNFTPMVDLIAADWMACTTIEDITNPFRENATVSICAQCVVQKNLAPIDQLEYMFLCQWNTTWGIAALPQALPILIQEKQDAWIKVKMTECLLSPILIAKKSVTYPCANMRIGDMANDDLKEMICQTGKEIVRKGLQGCHMIEVTEYNDDSETVKVGLHLSLGMTRMVIVNLGNPILVLFRELK